MRASEPSRAHRAPSHPALVLSPHASACPRSPLAPRRFLVRVARGRRVHARRVHRRVPRRHVRVVRAGHRGRRTGAVDAHLRITSVAWGFGARCRWGARVIEKATSSPYSSYRPASGEQRLPLTASAAWGTPRTASSTTSRSRRASPWAAFDRLFDFGDYYPYGGTVQRRDAHRLAQREQRDRRRGHAHGRRGGGQHERATRA